VHAHLGDGRVPAEHLLDRGGREVLAVDAHPATGPAGEVDPLVVGGVRQVAGVEPAPAHAVGVGGGGAPVAGEHAESIGDHLYHGLVGVEQATVRGEAGARALGAGVRVDDQHAGGARTQGGVGGVGRAGDGDAALAGAEIGRAHV